MKSPRLGRIMLVTLVWLPPCFALWYWAGHWFIEPAFWIARKLLMSQFPDLIQGLLLKGHDVVLFTRIHPFHKVGEHLVVEAPLVGRENILYYFQGQPLLGALLLASQGEKLARRLTLGLLILVPFQIWGVVFVQLSNLADVLGPAVSAQVGADSWYWRRSLIVFGFQIGNLLFPTLVPIIVWLGLSRVIIWPKDEFTAINSELTNGKSI